MSKFPAWTVFKRVDATTLDQCVPNLFTKASTTSITSNTTLANDSELTGMALGIGTWEVECDLYVAGTTAGQIKSAWTFSGTTSGTPNKAVEGPGTANAGTASHVGETYRSFVSYTSTISYGVITGSTFVVKEKCTSFVVTVAGSLSIQFAQVVSNATASTVSPGSTVKFRQIA